MRILDETMKRPFAVGRAFVNASMQEVEDFLHSRKMETITAPPDTFNVSMDDGKYMLRHRAGTCREFPMRRTFFEKLLRWQDLSAATLDKFDPGVRLDVLNNCLRVISRNVQVCVENGDALTILSQDYTELRDADILENCRRHIVTKVTRDDYLLRVGFDERFKVEPVKGDVCGLGFNVCNSETGFMVLRADVFIMRYICSNGAVTSEGVDGDSGISHYKVRKEELQQYLDQRIRTLAGQWKWIAERLSRTVSAPALPGRVMVRDLDRILGFGHGRYFMEDFDAGMQQTRYAQFNYVTDRAKRYTPMLRLRLERFAGTLLNIVPPPGRTPRSAGTSGTARSTVFGRRFSGEHPAFEPPEGSA